MGNLQERISNIDDFDNLIKLLVKRIELNNPISLNGMYDGFIIGCISENSKLSYLLLSNKLNCMLPDITKQKLQLVGVWILENEDILCDLIDRNK